MRNGKVFCEGLLGLFGMRGEDRCVFDGKGVEISNGVWWVFVYVMGYDDWAGIGLMKRKVYDCWRILMGEMVNLLCLHEVFIGRK
ncbi:hypothetical protein, partial [Bacillus subtilis]|uniref:hypothetical protein n=1 Tax=Bacillus subtilis TaxID=1423 RepID=UPI001BDBA027